MEQWLLPQRRHIMSPNAWDCIYSKGTWHQRKHLGPWGGARRLENPGGSSLIIFKIRWESQGGSQASKGQRGAGETPWREGTWPSQEVCRSLGMEKGYTLKNVDSLWKLGPDSADSKDVETSVLQTPRIWILPRNGISEEMHCSSERLQRDRACSHPDYNAVRSGWDSRTSEPKKKTCVQLPRLYYCSAVTAAMGN